MDKKDPRALAGKAAAGDMDAAEDLAYAMHDDLFTLLYLQGVSMQDVEDVAQDVMVRIFRDLGSYDEKRAFMPWFRSIVRSTAADYWRKKAGEQRRMDVLVKYVRDRVSVDVEAVDTDLVRQRIQKCIERLKDRAKAIVLLRYYEDLSSPEISSRLELKAGTVRQTLARAREALRSCIGIDSVRAEKRV